MSTKTTFKRIALVAVAALGFGTLSVAPSSANGFNSGTHGGEVTTVSAAIAGQALRVGVQSQILVTFTGPAVTATNDSGTATAGGFSATTKVVYPNMRVLTAPAAATTTTVTPATASAILGLSSPSAFVNDNNGNGSSAAAIAPIGAPVSPALNGRTVSAGIKWTPSHAGTYSFLFWDDADKSAALGGATEKFVIATFVVGNEIASLAMSTTINNGTTVGSTYSAVVRVTAKDAAGNATVPSGADSVTLTTTGSAKFKYSFVRGNNVDVSGAGTNTAFLTSADFDSSGNAYIGVTNEGVAETVTITPALIGSLTTPTVTTTTVTFRTPTTHIATNANVAVAPLNTTTVRDSADFYAVPLGTAAGLIITTAAAATAVSAVAQLGIDAGVGTSYGNGNIIGVTTVTTVAAAATGYALGTLAYSSPSPSATTANRSDTLVVGGTSTTLPDVLNLTATNRIIIATRLTDATAAGITVSPASPTVATGGTVNLTVTVLDAGDNARAGIAVTAAFNAGGRNSGKALASAITDADGVAKFSYVDTNSSAVTTAVSDVITFTTTSPLGTTVTKNATVSYVSGLTVSTVTMTTPNQTAGVARLAVVPQPITFGAAGPTAGAVAVTATVTTSTGAVLAGLPVTWSVAGTTAAVTSNTRTSYTSGTGVATASVYAWATGTYTITATAGGVSATGTITFTQEDPASARTVSAAAKDNVVTATVKDRFGNAVRNSIIFARVSAGNGYFGNGVLSTEGTTDANGEVRFVVAGGSATVQVSNISFSAVAGTQVGQTSAPKGYVVAATTNSATVGIFTASAAGTDTTAEKGVGASFDAAGVSSATVEVNIADQAQAAADAAAEATDAANAATDAANAAAEAADAATAAAQDAADAVAALATSVEAMVNALKRQITSLTNLVIKIQKKVRA
jgi:trimeric autotransporter adhesin